MKRDEIRLEVLRLAHRHDRSPAEVVTVAGLYEQYVQGPETDPVEEVGLEAEKPKAGRPRKSKWEP